MRGRRPHTPVDHVLVAGHVDDFPAMQRVLALLPAATYGQVFIEGRLGDERPQVCVPPRVTVTWLIAGPSGEDRERGALLATAVEGWYAEWSPEEPQPDREFSIWIGDAASAQVNSLCERLDLQLARL